MSYQPQQGSQQYPPGYPGQATGGAGAYGGQQIGGQTYPNQPGMYSPTGGQPIGFSGQPGGYGAGQQTVIGQQGGYGAQQQSYGQYPKAGFAGQPPMAGTAFPGVQSGGFAGGQPGGFTSGQPTGFIGGQPGYGGLNSQAQNAMGFGTGQSTFQAPTTFQVRRNFFANGGQMDILTNGVPHFRCISTPSPLGYGLNFTLTDLSGNQLCTIQPDQSSGMPHFHIYLRGALYATLKQDWSPSEKKFEVHNKQTGEELRVYGDWFAQNFEFQRRHSGPQVAQVSSGYGGSDLFDVTVSPGEDALFILAATLCIEKVCHEHKHHHKHNW